MMGSMPDWGMSAELSGNQTKLICLVSALCHRRIRDTRWVRLGELFTNAVSNV